MIFFSYQEGIQTTAVGYADNFDLQINLGLFLGERLVLWDTVLRSLIFNFGKQFSLEDIGSSANYYFELEELIKSGRLIILPQSHVWNERAKIVRDEIKSKKIPTYVRAWASINALLAEGFHVSPYFVGNHPDLNYNSKDLTHTHNKPISTNKAIEQFVLEKSFFSEKIECVGKLRPKYYNSVLDEHGDELRRSIRSELMDLVRKNSASVDSYYEAGFSCEPIVKELKKHLKESKSIFRKRDIPASLLCLSAVQASFSFVESFALDNLMKQVVTGLGLAASIGFLVHDRSVNHKNVLVQHFKLLNQAYKCQQNQDNVS